MKKKLTIAACVMLCTGIIIAGTAAAVMKFDFSMLNTTIIGCPASTGTPGRGEGFAGRDEKDDAVKLVTRAVEESFTSLQVTSDSCSVELLPSENDTISVEYPVADGIKHSVTVKNGTLEVIWRDERSWNNRIGIYFGTEDVFCIRIYLPYLELEAAEVQTSSGNIEIGEGWSLGRVSLTSSSGEIDFCSDCTGFYAVSTSGNIEVSGISCPEALLESTSGEITLKSAENLSRLRMKSTSGDIKLRAVTCGDAYISSTSGELDLQGLEASGEVRAETTSGSIDLERCDGARLEMTSSSGDIEGLLLSGKVFSASSGSGDIELPASDPSGGECRIKTVSGDISIVIEA